MKIRTKIFTIGYGGKKPVEFFAELEALKPACIVDVRENPEKAYLGSYTKSYFEKRLDHYVWIKELGNVSRTLPPKLVNEDEGLEKLEILCEKNARIVLLCAEKDENRCHRGYVKEKIVNILENHD